MPTTTPGYNWTDGELVTYEKLRQSAAPVVGLTAADTAAVAAALSTGRENFFRNADLSQWTRGTTSVNCPGTALPSTKTYRADYWWVRPISTTSGTATYEQQEETAGLSPDDDFVYLAKVTGGANLTAIEIGQDILARLAAELSENFVVTAELENQTGSTLTPKARIYTANARDNFTGSTLREEVSATDINGAAVTMATNSRAVVYFRFTAASYKSHLRNGAEVCVVNSNATGGYLCLHAQAKLEEGTTPTARNQERQVDSEDTAADVPFRLALVKNGALNPQAWSAATVSVTTADTHLAAGWYAKTASNTVTLSRDTATVPNTTVAASAKLLSDAVVAGVVVFGQKIHAADAATHRVSLAFQAYCRYFNGGFGTSFVPSLVVKTCNTTDSFDAVTERLRQPLSDCPTATWTLLSHVFDAGALTNFGNGARIEIEVPTTVLDAATSAVWFTALDVSPASAVPAFRAAPQAHPAPVFGGTKNLKVIQAVSDGTNFVITADDAILVAADGQARRYSTVSVACEATAGGIGGLDTGAMANTTEYDLWLVGGDTSVAAIMCLASAAAPAGAGSYQFRHRIGTYMSNSAAAFDRIFQRNQRVYLQAAKFLRTEALSDKTWQQIVFTNQLPARAVAVQGSIGTYTNDTLSLAIAGHVDAAVAIGAEILNSDIVTQFSALTGAEPWSQRYYTALPFDAGIYVAKTIWVYADTTSATDASFELRSYDLPN